MQLSQSILEFINENKLHPFTVHQLAAEMGFDGTGFDIAETEKALKRLVDEGALVITSKRKYALPSQMGLRRGIIRGNERGFAFFVGEDGREDLFILNKHLEGALNGDTVLAREIKSDRPNSKNEGEVVKILTRANNEIVGTLFISGSRAFVLPDDKRISTKIFISGAHGTLINGSKVIAKITNWHDGKIPEGIIKDVIGKRYEPGVDIMSIAHRYGLNEMFAPAALKAADSLNKPVSESEKAKRLDLTDKIIFTIDGADAKDFDDAISIDVNSDGTFTLGVHIADVSHYVKTGTALDREAYSRGTSVYLINKVLPMLPKSLSNGICSLNEGVDRLTLSVFMKIDSSGSIIDSSVHKACIKSVHRMTYTDVNAMLEREDTELCAKYSDILPVLKQMEKLASVLRKKRMERGSIDMDVPEALITLDESGKPSDISIRENGVSNKMIEEFMLAANETIAEMMFFAQLPCVYRIHELPDKEKLQEFSAFASNLGLELKGRAENIHPKQLAQLLDEAERIGIKPLISMVMLRAMSKARYSETDVGHFGLSLKHYCHFTSPIRRYPDLIVHRLVTLMLEGKLDEGTINRYNETLHDACEHCSFCERNAMETERAVYDMKKAEYMSDYIGCKYKGIISGITPIGIFVSLPNTIEGMIRISNMKRFFIADPERYRAIAQDNGEILKLGEQIEIIVLAADIEMGKIEFGLCDTNTETGKANCP